MKALCCVDKNMAIGCEGGMLFSLPGDLAFYRDNTKGKTVVCGRKTLLSYPKQKPLPGRNNIILSGSMEAGVTEMKNGYEMVVLNTPDQVRAYLKENNKWDETIIGGGSEIYKIFLEDCDEIILTEVEAEAEKVDSYFPDFKDQFHLTEEEGPITDGDFTYYRRTYTRNV